MDLQWRLNVRFQNVHFVSTWDAHLRKQREPLYPQYMFAPKLGSQLRQISQKFIRYIQSTPHPQSVHQILRPY